MHRDVSGDVTSLRGSERTAMFALDDGERPLLESTQQRSQHATRSSYA